MEAKFCCIISIVVELDWLSSILTELGIKINKPLVINCDNLRAIHFTNYSTHSTKMKHVALEFNFVQESIDKGKLQVIHISNLLQTINIMTKTLHLGSFKSLRDNFTAEPP